MPMTDTKARNAKPKDKQFKLFDTEGLFLLVSPAGGKWWRFKYRFGGKEKLISLGTYPEVGLAMARQRRDAARKQVADGIDPSQARKALKSAIAQNENTFEMVAREWHAKFTPTWTPGHAAMILRRLELNVFPWIGARPIIDIKAPELLMVLRRIESRGALETAHRVRIICGQVFRYAVATGRAERDPSADLRGALPPVKPKHFSAITDPEKVGGLLRAIDGYQGSFVTKCALRLAPLLFVRPGELRQMEWAEIDLEAAEWNIPAEKIKTRQAHLVPLPHQSLEILRELHPLTGSGKYVFPSPRTPKRPMSNNGVLSALRRMGFEKDEMTGHGFRAMARTILDEVLQIRPDFIEHQLANAVRDPNGRAYNRTAHLPERRKMMQTWADYLDGLKEGAKVIPMRKQAEQ
ncbi:MAG TPA: integrase arm-type DNA-binding domain-containing protein [Deltaproteobacteria bacterium]|nr:integrase arm-type DNA-binding domain-containing protein [Deltaproteobacteria bacterium]